MDPFFIRALAAGIGLAIMTAPLGCFVVWRRMAYFGETIAQASLIGVALALAVDMNVALAVFGVTLAMAGLLIALQRQSIVPLDSILGTMHYVALAVGIIATARLAGPSVDIMGYLFGDVLAVTTSDLMLEYAGAAVVLVSLYYLWRPLLRISIDPELAAAEGVPVDRVRMAFTLLLAIAIALAIKAVGALLAIAFLIIPAVAARPLAETPERMALFATSIAAGSVVLGLAASARFDVPSGPAIVVVMAAVALWTSLLSAVRSRGNVA